MTSWKGSVRRAIRAGALLLTVPVLGFPQSLSESLDGVVETAAAPRPSALIPAPSGPLPVVPAGLTAGRAAFPVARPFLGRSDLPFPGSIEPEGGTSYTPQGFSVRLLARMNHEARRYRSENVTDGWGSFPAGPADGSDPAAEDRRSDAASRVILRSTHRALDEEIEHRARTSAGLGRAIDLLQNLSWRRVRGQSPDAGPAEDAAPAGVRMQTSRLRTDFGLRLDAHPALLFKAQFMGLRGRLEMPVRGEPLRLSMESPVGRRGRAVLSSGLPRDGQGWATLTFSFSF